MKFNFRAKKSPFSSQKPHISQLSFSEMRIKEKKSLKTRLRPLFSFLTFLPVYIAKKQQKLSKVIGFLFRSVFKFFYTFKGFLTIKLIWGRGRLARPFIYIGVLFLVLSVFLTGGVFQKNLIVLSSDEQEVFVTSSSDIVPQPVLVSTEEPNTKIRDTVVTHTVKSGDTLSSIGKRYGVTLDTIRYANDLTDTAYLKVGQELTIPPVSGVVHTVEEGETIDSLAEEFGVPTQAIADFNYLAAPFTLREGQELVLPNADIPQPKPVVVQQPNTNTQYGGSDYTFVPNAGSGASGSGAFLWPTPSRLITQYFSWYHPAIDVAVPGPIFASDSGVVVRSGWWANGYGFAIQIDHRNGYVTTYAHMSRLDVSVGQSVEKGQTIGYMGSTGRSTGPHVHFTIQRNGQFLNPMEFF